MSSQLSPDEYDALDRILEAVDRNYAPQHPGAIIASGRAGPLADQTNFWAAGDAGAKLGANSTPAVNREPGALNAQNPQKPSPCHLSVMDFVTGVQDASLGQGTAVQTELGAFAVGRLANQAACTAVNPPPAMHHSWQAACSRPTDMHTGPPASCLGYDNRACASKTTTSDNSSSSPKSPAAKRPNLSAREVSAWNSLPVGPVPSMHPLVQQSLLLPPQQQQQPYLGQLPVAARPPQGAPDAPVPPGQTGHVPVPEPTTTYPMPECWAGRQQPQQPQLQPHQHGHVYPHEQRNQQGQQQQQAAALQWQQPPQVLRPPHVGHHAGQQQQAAVVSPQQDGMREGQQRGGVAQLRQQQGTCGEAHGAASPTAAAAQPPPQPTAPRPPPGRPWAAALAAPQPQHAAGLASNNSQPQLQPGAEMACTSHLVQQKQQQPRQAPHNGLQQQQQQQQAPHPQSYHPSNPQPWRPQPHLRQQHQPRMQRGQQQQQQPPHASQQWRTMLVPPPPPAALLGVSRMQCAQRPAATCPQVAAVAPGRAHQA
ncbi:hypothetical protein Agub_g14734, partial [Astrephomene gubernaculifera]